MQPDRHALTVAKFPRAVVDRSPFKFPAMDDPWPHMNQQQEVVEMVSSTWGFHDLYDRPYTKRGWRCTQCRRTIFIGDNELSTLYHECNEEADLANPPV